MLIVVIAIIVVIIATAAIYVIYSTKCFKYRLCKDKKQPKAPLSKPPQRKSKDPDIMPKLAFPKSDYPPES